MLPKTETDNHEETRHTKCSHKDRTKMSKTVAQEKFAILTGVETK
jgi:hypothetical protein